ncbi:hypothetical protein VNI00_013638 [Paramarasmius palmivorus]|uniref:Beta-lactamase-related domain-containing protein n=1 Tax=Paramarasmius palmivorus TaxID=297713 RepID=A0AAW0BXJ1_9AGAR
MGVLALLILYISTLVQIIQRPLRYTSTDLLDSDTDTFIEGVISSWNSSGGVGVAVVKQYEDGSWQVETKGYGIAKVTEEKKPDGDSLFYIASNSKLFTTIATGLLISNESLSPRLSWDTKFADVLPEHTWKLQDPVASAGTTIIDAMSHRTGLPRHDSMYSKTDDVESILRRARYLKASASFRSSWQYNNIMYMLLGYLPTVTLPGKPTIATYVKEHIFDPLGLSSATYSLDTAKRSGHLVDPIAREVNKTEELFGRGKTRVVRYPTWFQEESGDESYLAGAGGIMMSVKDAVRTWALPDNLDFSLDVVHPFRLLGFKSFYWKDKIHEQANRLSLEKLSAADVSNRQYPEVSNPVYGGGQRRSSYRGNDIIEHEGAITGKKFATYWALDSTSRYQLGYHTCIARLPNSKLGIAVFTNDDDYGASFMQVIKWRIIDKVLGLEPIDWDSRMKARDRERYQKQLSKIRSRPENPIPPPVPFEQLAGVYHDLGYGGIELCYVSAPHPIKESDICQKLREEHVLILPNAVNNDIPILLARWDRFRYSHFKLEHVNGALFTATKLDSRPTDDPPEPYWTATADELFTVEFVVEDGKAAFGLMNGFWGAGPGVESPVEGNMKEIAEVWFEQI